ncbi:PAS domain-containing protein [Alteribacillus sp. JSM 102045]|uniref:PAS domain-containing protein n=1 Tax=Alteribacillus sp. JSM 102045 TaxID=1562101 RepID=UPI0035C2319C
MKATVIDTLQDSPFAFFQTNKKGTIIDLNQEARELFPEQFQKGENVYDFFEKFEPEKDMFVTEAAKKNF